MRIDKPSVKEKITFQNLTSDPTGAIEGDVYYNSTDKKFKYYDNTSWVKMGADYDISGVQLYNAFGSAATSLDLSLGDGTFDTIWNWYNVNSNNGSVSIINNSLVFNSQSGGASSGEGVLTLNKELFTQSDTVFIRMQITLTGNEDTNAPHIYVKLRDDLEAGNEATLYDVTGIPDNNLITLNGTVSDTLSTVTNANDINRIARFVWIKLVKVGTNIEVYRIWNSTDTNSSFTVPTYEIETETLDATIDVSGLSQYYLSFNYTGSTGLFNGSSDRYTYIQGIWEGNLF